MCCQPVKLQSRRSTLCPKVSTECVNEAHDVVATPVEGQWLILDNRTLTLVRDVGLQSATPLHLEGRSLVENDHT